MESLPARDFIEQFVSAYGETWHEAFGNLTHTEPCAKHMAEFIDDLEIYGQQEPVYVDEDGCVMEGNKVVLAQYILGNDIDFVRGGEPQFDISHLYYVEFEIDYGPAKLLDHHPLDFMSFRMEDYWVYPIDHGLKDRQFYFIMYHQGDLGSVSNMEHVIEERLQNLAGIGIIGYHVSEVEAVDEDASE